MVLIWGGISADEGTLNCSHTFSPLQSSIQSFKICVYATKPSWIINWQNSSISWNFNPIELPIKASIALMYVCFVETRETIFTSMVSEFSDTNISTAICWDSLLSAILHQLQSETCKMCKIRLCECDWRYSNGSLQILKCVCVRVSR